MRARFVVGLMALFVTALTVLPLSAEPATPSASPPTERSWLRQPEQRATPQQGPSQVSLGKWFAGAVLVGLSGFVLWKHRRQRRAVPPALASAVEIGAITRLSPKAQLVVATVNGRSMLLGVTDASITRLMWLGARDDDAIDDDDDEANEPVSHLPKRPGTGNGSAVEAAGLRPQVVTRKFETNDNLVTTRSKQRGASARQGSRFGELLADALGIGQRQPQKQASRKEAVDEIAADTVDRYVGAATRVDRRSAGNRTAAANPLINVEGQAAGLVARLNRHQS